MNKFSILILFAATIFLLKSCSQKAQTKHTKVKNTEVENTVLTGVEVLQRDNFSLLQGKRVGLITNPTGVNRLLESTIDILHRAPQVNLVALYAPEHGVRGDYAAGAKFTDTKDEATGLPVFSLYGKKRKPRTDALTNIDVLVYDIQDIGVRSYTFISTMGLAMEVAAKHNIEFVVLDRPNPLGGNRIEGPLVRHGFTSFVSQYPIPYIYGLTPGELAFFLKEEKLISNAEACKLKVVSMQNWKRKMVFSDTKLPWVLTSPHIPRATSSFFYAATGILGELDPNAIGIGYTLPFELLAAPWLPADKVATQMNALQLEGVVFRPIYYRPYYMKNKGKTYAGVQIHITNFETVNLTAIQFYFLEVLHKLAPEKKLFAWNKNRHAMFDKVCGSDSVRLLFTKNFRYADLKAYWEQDQESFRERAKKYYLYE